jgi:hypothetical protein
LVRDDVYLTNTTSFIRKIDQVILRCGLVTSSHFRHHADTRFPSKNNSRGVVKRERKGMIISALEYLFFLPKPHPHSGESMKTLKITLLAASSFAVLALIPTKAQLIITEVDPSGSGNANGYVQDWFEVTNYGTSAVDITGWKMDDNSNSFSSAVPITNLTSIGAGKSAVFIEDTGSTAASEISEFEQSWFGNNVPAGFEIGAYGGSGVGLSQSGDAVNLFNSTGTLEAGVQFGVSTNKVSFDNSVAKITNTGSTDGTISTISVAGVNGAYISPTNPAGEVGSPGTVGAVPEPSSWALALLVAGGFAMMVCQQKAKRA